MTVTTDQVRALCAGSHGRTVLVLAPAGPRVVTPDAAWHGLWDGTYRMVLCTRSQLLDDGLREGRDGQLVGPTVEICSRIAAYLTRLLAPTGSVSGPANRRS